MKQKKNQGMHQNGQCHICICLKRMLNKKPYFILSLSYQTLPRLFSGKRKLGKTCIFQCVLTLLDWASCPGLVNNLSRNVPIFHIIFQIIDLHAIIKSKLIDINFRYSTNLSMTMFWNPKKRVAHYFSFALPEVTSKSGSSFTGYIG